MTVTSGSKDRDGEAEGGKLALWIVTIAVGAAALPVFIYFLSFAHGRLTPMLWSGAVLLLAAVSLVALMISEMRHAANRDARLSVRHPRPAAGGKLLATVFISHRAADVGKLYAGLTCWRLEAGSPTEAVWSTKQEVPTHETVRGAIAKIDIDIPAGAFATSPQYRWELQLEAEAADLDFNRSFQVLVAGAGSPPPAAAAPAGRPAGDAGALVFLVAANLVPLAGAVLWGWRVQDVVMLYWIENLIIGAFQVLRIAMATEDGMQLLSLRGALPSDFHPRIQLLLAKTALIGFFVLHYGGFCFVHGTALATFFPREERTYGLTSVVEHVLQERGTALMLLAICASHAFSFLRNYLGRGEYRNANLTELMARPYKRVGVTHLFILAGGFLVVALKTTLLSMAAFVAIKTWLDARAHRKERAALAGAPVSA